MRVHPPVLKVIQLFLTSSSSSSCHFHLSLYLSFDNLLLIKIRAIKYAGRDGRTISDQMQHVIVNQMSEDLEEDQYVTADSHSVTCLVKTEVKKKEEKDKYLF